MYAIDCNFRSKMWMWHASYGPDSITYKPLQLSAYLSWFHHTYTHTSCHHTENWKYMSAKRERVREGEREKVVFWPHVSLITWDLPQWPPTNHNTATHLTRTQSTVVVDYVRQHFHGRHQHQQLNCYLRGCKGESKWPEGDNHIYTPRNQHENIRTSDVNGC